MTPIRSKESLKSYLLSTRLASPADWAQVESDAVSGEGVSEILQFLERRQILTPLQTGRILKGETDGLVLGQYKLLYRNASGSFARVFRASTLDNKQVVALKLLRERWADDPRAVASFQREARICQKFIHPNIVPILDIGSQGRFHYFTMEFVEGGNLRDFLKIRHSVTPLEATRCLYQICRGLEYALTQGATHRDLKLTNVLMSSTGVAKLVDFGLAGAESPTQAGASDDVQRALEYSSLERGTNAPRNDPRSDIFFAGSIYYEMLSGESPWPRTADREERLQLSRYSNVKPLNQVCKGLPPIVVKACERMMELSPSSRFQSCTETAAALREVLIALGDPTETALVRSKQTTGPRADYQLLVVDPGQKRRKVLQNYFEKHQFRLSFVDDVDGGFKSLKARVPPEGILFFADDDFEPLLNRYPQIQAYARNQKVPCVAVFASEDKSRVGTAITSTRYGATMFQPTTLRDIRQHFLEVSGIVPSTSEAGTESAVGQAGNTAGKSSDAVLRDVSPVPSLPAEKESLEEASNPDAPLEVTPGSDADINVRSSAGSSAKRGDQSQSVATPAETPRRRATDVASSSADDDTSGKSSGASARVRAAKLRAAQLKAEKEEAQKARSVTDSAETLKLEAARNEQERLERENLERLERERSELETRVRLEKERLEREKQIRERILQEERERLENLRLEKEARERLERERLEKERLEREARERLEQERLEKSRLERERIAREEQERLERERLQKERLEQERLERERIEREERERLERERLEKERLERERLEREEQERLERERLEQERLEKERLERERLEREEQERLERERLEKERLEQERLEKARLERERIAREERERLERERLERERIQRELEERLRLEQERLERERAELERLEAERRELERLEQLRQEELRKEQERLELERAEIARLEQERIERERAELARLERERIEQERLEQERIALQIAEQERQERIRREQERLEAERAELTRLEEARREQQRREQELLERLKLEDERLEIELAELAELERQRIDIDRATQARVEQERLERERLERELAEQERSEQERLERVQREQERLERERAELEKLEALRRDRLRAEMEFKEKLEREHARLESERLELRRLEEDRLQRESHEQLRLEQIRKEIDQLQSERARLTDTVMQDQLPDDQLSVTMNLLSTGDVTAEIEHLVSTEDLNSASTSVQSEEDRTTTTTLADNSAAEFIESAESSTGSLPEDAISDTEVSAKERADLEWKEFERAERERIALELVQEEWAELQRLENELLRLEQERQRALSPALPTSSTERSELPADPKAGVRPLDVASGTEHDRRQTVGNDNPHSAEVPAGRSRGGKKRTIVPTSSLLTEQETAAEDRAAAMFDDESLPDSSWSSYTNASGTGTADSSETTTATSSGIAGTNSFLRDGSGHGSSGHDGTFRDDDEEAEWASLSGGASAESGRESHHRGGSSEQSGFLSPHHQDSDINLVDDTETIRSEYTEVESDPRPPEKKRSGTSGRSETSGDGGSRHASAGDRPTDSGSDARRQTAERPDRKSGAKRKGDTGELRRIATPGDKDSGGSQGVRRKQSDADQNLKSSRSGAGTGTGKSSQRRGKGKSGAGMKITPAVEEAILTEIFEDVFGETNSTDKRRKQKLTIDDIAAEDAALPLRTAGVTFKAPERHKRSRGDDESPKKAEPILKIQLGKRQLALSRTAVVVIAITLIGLSLSLLMSRQ